MDDRELLRLAAIAGAELRGEWVNSEAYFDGVLTRWNPLTDDGDALRLAVKIGVDIQPKGSGVEVWVFESRVSSGVVEYGDNRYAATRRAIVRAAAELQRQKENK